MEILRKGRWKLNRSTILSTFGQDGGNGIWRRWLPSVFSGKWPDFEKALALLKSAQRDRIEGPLLFGG